MVGIEEPMAATRRLGCAERMPGPAHQVARLARAVQHDPGAGLGIHVPSLISVVPGNEQPRLCGVVGHNSGHGDDGSDARQAPAEQSHARSRDRSKVEGKGMRKTVPQRGHVAEHAEWGTR